MASSGRWAAPLKSSVRCAATRRSTAPACAIPPPDCPAPGRLPGGGPRCARGAPRPRLRGVASEAPRGHHDRGRRCRRDVGGAGGAPALVPRGCAEEHARHVHRRRAAVRAHRLPARRRAELARRRGEPQPPRVAASGRCGASSACGRGSSASTSRRRSAPTTLPSATSSPRSRSASIARASTPRSCARGSTSGSSRA